MTKTAFRCVQIVLLFYGVFGADEDEVKAVSVMEGDSVTLNPDLTQIKTINLIEWRFGDPVIAQTGGNDISYPSYTEIFRGRLQLDVTGSLTIKNMKTKHAGLYELQISHSAGTAERKFNVTVYESASDPGESEMKSESVKEGDPVALQTGVTQISGEELIVWRFGDEGKVIAKADIEAKSSPLYYDGRFRDRLELELDQTGSLIITNTRSTDSGFYSVKISSNKQTVHKRFSVSVIERGLSSGAVAGIVLVVLAVVAAAAAGFIYYRRKISELQKQIWRYVSMTEGESIHLPTDHPEIERGDVIQWRFGGEIIAEIKGGTGKTHDGADGRFRARLQLDKRTGDLTIKNFTYEDEGYYKLKIISSKGNTNRTYHVTIRWRHVFVTVGESVHLPTDHPKIERGDKIQWRFGDEIIAEIKGGTGETHYVPDGRFRDRLELDKITGDLTIKNCTNEDDGDYNLNIRSSKGNTDRAYLVIITWRRVFVIAGDSVHLSTDRPKIERDDVIQWMFGEEIIAEIKEGTRKTHDGPDGRFRDRLQLDKITGDLTIKSSTDEDDGYYKLKIRSRKGNTDWTYSVTIKGSRVYVIEGESVHLPTDHPEIESGDVIQWRFRDEIIAEVKGGTGETHDGADERFRDRLQLDKITGDLTIKSSTAEDEGDYKLKISSSEGNTNRAYRVILRDKPREKSPVKGNNGKRVDESVVEMQPLMT